MTEVAPGASKSPSTVVSFAPRVPGFFILPNSNSVIDAARLLSGGAGGIVAETITGGAPDASDQLPEGTIIVSP
jgi:hypothetical protein